MVNNQVKQVVLVVRYVTIQSRDLTLLKLDFTN